MTQIYVGPIRNQSPAFVSIWPDLFKPKDCILMIEQIQVRKASIGISVATGSGRDDISKPDPPG